ncbi:MAG: alpha/beta fold hydrolase [Pseudomonadota bacterium]
MGAFGWLLLGAVGALTILWFTRQPMTARVRRLAPGQFAKLKSGAVHYAWHGPKGSPRPVLVLIHGLTNPSFIWRDMLPALTAAGYRVLVYDHFGRGFSDRPWTQYDMDFYVTALDELLDKLGVTGAVDVLGYSMGGGIAAAFAVRRPDRVRRVALLAPVGFLDPRPDFMARWPILGDAVSFVLGGWLMRRAARRVAEEESLDPGILRLQLRETRFAGYTAAVLSSNRHVIFHDQTEDHRILRDRAVPVAAIFGAADPLVTETSALRLRQVNRAVEMTQVAGAGHSLAVTHSTPVTHALRQFLETPGAEEAS